MSQDISGFGTVVTLTASVTFPAGLTITQFADDNDPVAIGAVQIADSAMGLNGDLVKWAKATVLPVVLNVIPDSDDDINLQVLFDANRVAKGKFSTRDDINMTISYPDGSIVIFTGGFCINGEFGKSVASAGRLKTKTYSFTFENKVGA
jgi:hypothetical protein